MERKVVEEAELSLPWRAPRSHAPAALIGSLSGLTMHLLIWYGLVSNLESGMECLWITLLAAPFTALMLVAVIAAFSENAGLRLVAVTAAFTSSFAPAVLFFLSIWLLMLGLAYLLPIGVLLLAVFIEATKPPTVRAALSVGAGLAAGAVFLVSYWPLFVSYHDDWQSAAGGYGESLSKTSVATGLGIVIGAVTLIVLTGLLLPEPSESGFSSRSRRR